MQTSETLCLKVVRSSPAERAAFFARGLCGNSDLLRRAARDWLDAAIWFPSAGDFLRQLLHTVWTAPADLAFESSRKGCRHTTTIFPFGRGSPFACVLRVPLAYLAAPAKEAVECFMASDACLNEWNHPTRGVLVVDAFQYNEVIDRVLEDYRMLLVCAILEKACFRARRIAKHLGCDPETCLADLRKFLVDPYLKCRRELGDKMVHIWKVAHAGSLPRLASALSA